MNIGPLHLELIQIFGIIFSLFAWSRAFLRYKDKKVSARSLFLWSVVWVSIIVVALYPELISSAANFLGIGRGMDVLIYVSIIVIFYLMFRLYVMMDAQNQEITSLVREIAINNPEKKKKEKK